MFHKIRDFKSSIQEVLTEMQLAERSFQRLQLQFFTALGPVTPLLDDKNFSELSRAEIGNIYFLFSRAATFVRKHAADHTIGTLDKPRLRDLLFALLEAEEWLKNQPRDE